MSQVDRVTGLVGYSGVKVPVAVCATANITLTGEQTIDGVTTNESRVLLTGQTDATENGIWVSDDGDWSRSTDCDGPYDLRQGSIVNVYGGTSNSGFWVCTSANPVDIETDNITFTRSSTTLVAISAFWQGVLAAANAAAARTALGAAASGANTDITSIYLNNTGLKIKDTDASHGLSVVSGSNLTADRTLTVTTGDADRTLTLAGSATISGTNTGDQVAATQAEQETATSTTVFVAPGRQQFHPSAAKFWIKCDASGAIQASNNVTSITDVGTGQVTVTIATDFSSVDYCITSNCQDTGSRFTSSTTQAAGSFLGQCLTSTSGAAADPANYFFAGFGDLV